MLYKDVLELIKKLPFDKKLTIIKDGNCELYVLRPSKVSNRFKNYDINKNFQIWLKEDNREFRPNHLRVMIDLSLRVRSRPDLKKELALIFDDIFNGKDPDIEIKKLEKEKFNHFLNSLRIMVNLSQLFLIEQDYAYNKESKFNPPTLFYQGWVRQVLNNTKEIDNICMSIANRNMPSPKYTEKENKKSKKFNENSKLLWYLEEK